jgi:hypothetical protein
MSATLLAVCVGLSTGLAGSEDAGDGWQIIGVETEDSR